MGGSASVVGAGVEFLVGGDEAGVLFCEPFDERPELCAGGGEVFECGYDQSVGFAGGDSLEGVA